MAAPTFQAEGTTIANTTGDLTIGLPSHLADDIIVLTLIIWAPNTSGAVAQIPTPSGYTLAGSQIQQPGGTADGWLAVFWKRAASSSESDPVCSRGSGWDTGADTCFGGRAYIIRGCQTSGNPFDDVGQAGPYTAANQPLPAVTVSGSERTVVQFGLMQDNNSFFSSSGWTAGTMDSDGTGTDCNFQTVRKENVSSSTGADAATGSAPAQGAYAFFGISFAPQTGITITAEVGSFTLTGNNANVLAARKISATAGAFVETGNAAGVLASRLISAAAGSFVLTGNDVDLVQSGGPPATNGGNNYESFAFEVDPLSILDLE